ncbi:MAG: YccF domain-containing protein [Acholeplasmatales bacterium]|nr:YccF domain-containing protein [Acholeplasmatales bacterium]
MKLLGNILWLIFGGLVSGIVSYIIGLLCCITVVLMPIGLQFFKIGSFFFLPMGKEVVNKSAKTGKTLLNVLWAILFGWEIALGYAVSGLLLCITIIGIPFGLQYFKLTKFALVPLGHDFKQKK